MRDGMEVDEVMKIHAELRTIAVQRQQLHAREAVLLARAEELAIWRRFGCATFLEYLERFCDLQPRTAKDYVRVARALTDLPLLRAQLEMRGIVYSTARELTRVATPETEQKWLAHVAGMSPREVEEAVAGHKRGDNPSDPKDPDRTVKLILEVRESTFAAFVEARARYADERGEPLTDDEMVIAMCRSGVEDPGASPHQLAINTCKQCAKSHQIGGGREVEVSAATVERARCDAVHLGDLERESPPRALRSVTKRMRQHVLARDTYCCSVPGCRSRRFLDVHHIVFESKRGSNKASNLITLCAGHHQQLHESKLAVTGMAPHALTFTWRDDPQRTSTRDRYGGSCPLGTSATHATFDDAARAAAAALDAMLSADAVPNGHEQHRGTKNGHDVERTMPTGHEQHRGAENGYDVERTVRTGHEQHREHGI